MDWKLFFATFGTLFLAELGDKTQLACILMTAKTQKPLTVFLGSAVALTLVSLIGVVFASAVCRFVPVEIVKKIAAVSFVVIGSLMFFDKL
ncbi:MAG: TMEM165/GDT1 family protein [Desulfovibrionaceae bacterium]